MGSEMSGVGATPDVASHGLARQGLANNGSRALLAIGAKRGREDFLRHRAGLGRAGFSLLVKLLDRFLKPW
jgi:hypothetical protein